MKQLKRLMKLYKYQERACQKIESSNKLILSIGMGLGKTPICLHSINQLMPKSLLIVAPKFVALNTWLQEAEKWGYDNIVNKMVIVSGTKAKRNTLLDDSSHPYKIVSRDNLNDVSGKSFDWVILDELTSFKNVLSLRSQIINTIQANKYIGLTGTFLANGAIDIFGQASALKIFNSSIRISKNGKYTWSPEFEAWKSQYFVNQMEGSGQAFKKWKLKVELNEVINDIKDNLFTLDSNDWLDIPEVTYNHHHIELSTEEINNYLQLSSVLSVELSNEVYSVSEEAKFHKLQTLANGFIYNNDGNACRGNKFTKLQAVADYCESCANEGEPVLLFYAFREEAFILSEFLTKRGLKHCSPNDKNFIKKWNDGKVDVLLSHPGSVAWGLNLQFGGRIIVWSSITFNYEYWKQANARLIRTGQTKGVIVNVFAAKNTIESKHFAAIMKKEKENKEFINLTK